MIFKELKQRIISETFKKRSFAIEVVNNNPSSISFSQKDTYNFDISNNNCQQLNDFSVGDEVEVLFNIKCKEYKREDSSESRVFTTLHAWRIQKPQINNFNNSTNGNMDNANVKSENNSSSDFSEDNIEEKDDLPFQASLA